MSQQRQKNYYFLSIRNEKSENFEFIDEFYSTLEEALQAAERLSEFEEFTPVRVFDFKHNICESVQLENGKSPLFWHMKCFYKLRLNSYETL